VIEYQLDPSPTAERDEETTYRLLTTIVDPKRAPAAELAALYPQRWEFETALDELKTHQRSPRVVLRSKMPDGVTQEAYGYLCVHYAIRWLMHSVAQGARADPRPVEFHAGPPGSASHRGVAPGFFPLRYLTTLIARLRPSCSSRSSRHDVCATTHARSNERCRTTW
jgi:hypothetical protein